MGLDIEAELKNAFSEKYDVIVVRHDGKRFEGDGIEFAIKLSIDTNMPVLYIHTKGAINNRKIVNVKMFCKKHDIKDIRPENIKERSIPKYVRNMWKNEFIYNMDKYVDSMDMKVPMVVCPYTGSKKITWLNGFIINPLAAKELKKTFHMDRNRFYYEQMFNNTKVKVVGIRMNDVIDDGIQSKVWSDMIKIYNSNDIDKQ